MGLIDSMRKKETVGGTSSNGLQAITAPNDDSHKHVKRRKFDETLASVVQESTVPGIIEALKQNDAFILPGGTFWVGLALPVANIGGLSKKQQKDEAKGSLIELINHGHIEVITTRSLLEEEVLGIIPTPETLDRMGEYSLLTQATYHWLVLRADTPDNLIVTHVSNNEPSYEQVVAIAKGARDLSAHLDKQLLAGVLAQKEAMEEANSHAYARMTEADPGTAPSPDADPFANTFASETTDTTPRPGSAAGTSTVEENIDSSGSDQSPQASQESWSDAFDEDLSQGHMDPPAFEDPDEGNFDAYEEELVDEDDEEEEADEDDHGGFVPEGSGDQVPAWQHYIEQNQNREFTEEQVQESIARRFLPEDLDLKIPFTEFEATFATPVPSVGLELDDDSTDWLGKQLTVRIKQANAELTRQHRDHREEERQLFVNLMSRHAEEVLVEVDDQRQGSVYQRLSVAAEEEFAGYKAQAAEEARAQRAEITRSYEEAANDRADVAAAQARQTFWDRNRPELERKCAEVAPEIARRDEERYAHQRRLVLELRSKEAHKRMALGTTQVLKHIGECNADHRRAQMKALQQANSELKDFLELNRQHDVARAEALAGQLALDNQVEEMQAKHTQQVEALKVEQEQIEHSLQAELARVRDRSEKHLREREQQWQHESAMKDEKLQSSHGMYTDLEAQTQRMGAEIHKQYRGQIEELQGDKHSYAQELQRTNHLHSRVIKVIVILGAVLVLAAMAVGLIIGWTMGYGPQ